MDVCPILREDGNHFPAELISSRRQFMKQVNWVVAVTLVVLSGLAAAQTIGSSRVVTQVPFEFVVANKTVPAGPCEVQAFTTDGKTLIIRNTGAKVGLLSTFTQTEGEQPAPHYALIFNHYGDRYFLSGLTLQGSKVTYYLPESRAEAELRAQKVSATEETLRASRE
jgi:hypothetical protein